MAKLEADTLHRAINAEEEALQEKARATVAARNRIAAAEESQRIAAQNQSLETALLEQERLNHTIALEHTQLLTNEIAVKERVHDELLQQNALVQARIEALHQERLEAEQVVESEAVKRAEAERQAADLAHQQAMSERLARKAADEKSLLQEKLKATAMSRAALDFKMSDKLRFELNNSHAMFETEQLLSRLRKSNLISKLSQAALVATLVITAGLWIVTPQIVSNELVTSSSIASAIQSPVQDKPIEVNGMKMSTELTMPEKVALNSVTQ
jgi:hypothetical protein